MRLKEQFEPGDRQVRSPLTDATMANHSHLMAPGIGPAFLASMPHAMTWPVWSYNRHVGIFLNVSKLPGQFNICWTFPPAMRDDPYA